MIARGAPVGAVCLRCRLRLLHQLSPAPVHNVASYATAAADADAGTDVNRANDQVDSKDAAEDDRQVYKDKPTGARRSRRGWKHFGAHKQYVSNNRVMSEVVRSLNSDMLGKPGHVIVMRDGGKLRRGLSALKNLEPEKPPESTSIEELLHSQREAQTTLEIRSNIHRLRPQTDTVLPKRRFEKLRDLLTSGFLSPQLQDYMLWHKSKAEDDSLSMALDTPSQPEFPWMKNRTAWVPLESEPSMADRTDFNLQGYVSETISPKQKLAIRLMRECWHLSIAELETELGETWIKLNDDEFTILMRGTQRFMNTLGKIWLDPGEQIEAFRREKMLRLVTTKYKVDSVIRDLDETLQCVTTKTFPIVLLGSGMPDDKILEHVGKITNSHIKKSHTLRRLHVTWLNIKSRAAHGLAAVEDIAHIVFRLLLTASGSPQVTSTLLPHTPSESHGGRLIVDVTSKEKLGWKDRLGQWARYAHPLSSEETVTDTALPIKKFELPFQPSIKEEDLDENVEFFPDTEFPKSPVKWSGDGKTSTTAHFGYILHPYQSSNPTPHLSNLLASTERRVFSPLAPHPLHFTKFESNDSGTAPVIGTRSTVVLRFWPSPSSQPISRPPDSPERSMPAPKHAKDTPPAPILELRLAASSGDQIIGVESLRAITRVHNTDVMLPSSPVDVRFTQTQYTTLQAPDHRSLAAWHPLHTFLSAARLELADGKLEMPPRQKFAIPERLLATKRPPKKARHQQTEKLISITYEFVGLELHRSAALPFEGHQLKYTSIEGGQGGGRRAEVTLESLEDAASATTEGSDDQYELLQENFLASCSRLATDRSLWLGQNLQNDQQT